MPIHDWSQVDAGLFHAFHYAWVGRLCDQLNEGLLPDSFYALPEQRTGLVEPDVVTLHSASGRQKNPSDSLSVDPPGSDARSATSASPHSTAAVIDLLEQPPQVAFVEDLDNEHYVRRRRSIAIRHVSGDDLVALIEILSPGNKSSRNHFEQFIHKAVSSIQAGVHLLAIDLHPPTARDPAGLHAAIARELGGEQFRFDAARPLTLAAYLAGPIPRAFVQPVAFREQLPEMPLFLTASHYVNLPLEPTYEAAFQSLPKRWRDVLT